MKLIRNGLDLTLQHGKKNLLTATKACPMIYVGQGSESVEMYRGNFTIEDYVTERRPLMISDAEDTKDGLLLNFENELTALVRQDGDCVTITFEQKNPAINRFWFRVPAEKGEHCYGCGEQMSYFDLRGRHFPLWTSEPGVGRDKSTYLTWRYDQDCKGGGDYYNTNYPQPTFVSSRHYYLHADASSYADFDFRNETFHELQFWQVPASIRMEAAETFPALLEKLTAFLGRQPELPDWIYNGLIVGVQGGSVRSFGIVDRSLAAGIPVSGVWCQDWAGVRYTSFGKRLRWDWHYNTALYPDLPGQITALHKRGIRFLGYISPYLCTGGDLFPEAERAGVFAKRADGSTYLVDFGEFDCGVIDLTDPKAYAWYKDNVIKKNMLDIGMDGYMCDFGEYLPTDDICLASGNSPMLEHNRWPVLWAKCNHDALVETGKWGQVVYFMRAGGTGSQKYCPLLWAGDQSVDFTRHDGLCTVISAALSAGMSGCGLTHSDIGGYTSMYENVRTKELFLRWAEMAAFTAVMRTHECNRPEQNFQYYDDEDCMAQLARLVNIYTALAPCLKALVAENARKGLPVQRPLFLHNEDDEACYTNQFEYLLGPDILVAPVWQSGVTEWEVYLPEGEWLHLWSGEAYGKGTHTVAAPLGDTPVFYKNNSPWAALLGEIREKYAK
ncbi:MAG: alpha-glucosidase [Clostridiales bacterium]|nr:alpha-glucosidase [Clostridiales bacterium]